MKFPYVLEIVAGTAIALHAIAASSGETHVSYARLADGSTPRITIGQAIVIAEQHAGGEAVEAELDREDGRLVYDVDVETADGDVEVIIDPVTGDVLSMGPDD